MIIFYLIHKQTNNQLTGVVNKNRANSTIVIYIYIFVYKIDKYIDR